MAIAIEGTQSHGNTEASTYTAETTGADRLLLIAFSVEDGSTPDVTGVTFGGVAATQAVTQRSGGTGGPYPGASLYYIKQANIPSGAQSCAITFDSDPMSTGPFISFYTLSGVDQTTPVDDTAFASLDNVSATSLAITLETNTSGGMAFAVFGLNLSGAPTITNSDGWTEDLDVSRTNYGEWLGHKALTGASETLTLSFNTSSFASLVGAAFKPAGGSTPTAALAAAYYYNR
jgi:hypothetical protein